MSVDLTSFPQGSGLGAYLKITKGVDLLKDNKEEDMATRTVKGLARFVTTYFTLVYFAKGGMLYNGVSLAGNAALGIVKLADDERQAMFHFKDCGRNVAYIGIDLLTLFTSTIVALSYTLFPGPTVRTYEQISTAISETRATN